MKPALKQSFFKELRGETRAEMELAELIAQRYWMLIRYATLNGLKHLQSEYLRDARECQRICLEDRTGKGIS